MTARKALGERWTWADHLARYGMTPEGWSALLEAQAGRCAICEEPMESPVVDHDHTTGRVRGLLCPSCNVLVGRFESKRGRAVLRYLGGGGGR